ncbi:MAG: hypothetical protein JO202_04605 [Ktedonobacteraceae bacterium]|nr:hypothetical protein [Ktedonobacteraceae bacterium]
MNPEQTRHERLIDYTTMLRERFESGVLAELQDLSQWVVWRAEVEEGKKKKVPYNPNSHLLKASVKTPKSWGTLTEALTALKTGNYSGLGFMITPPLVMLDLDNSFDRKTGTITSPHAAEIVTEVDSFFEASPYKGLHGLIYVERPIRNVHTDALEIYGHDRFTTITTDHIAGTPTTIKHRTEALEALYRRFAPPVEERASQNTGGGVVAVARLTELPPEAARDAVLQELLRGDMSRYGNDHHRADWHLLMKLLHWTGDDRQLTKSLFLHSPLGQRPKAQEPEGRGKRGNTNYVDRTIDRILQKRHHPPMRR